MRFLNPSLIFVSLALCMRAESSQETRVLRSKISDQTQVALTVYSNGRTMVRDRRKMNFEKGLSQIEIQDVSGQMRAETARFRSLGSAADIKVIEQNLEADLLSPQKLLEKFVGKKIFVIRTHPTNGSEIVEPAEVVAVQNGVVLKLNDRIETGTPGRLSFPNLPEGLRSEPTLSLLVESKKRGEQDVELNYMSDGISWKADYIAELNAEENKTHLTGLVTLTNQSGTSFRDAQVQLMGGDIQTVDRGYAKSRRTYTMDMAMSASASFEESSSASTESFFEYHLYSLPRSMSVLSNQTKQVTLLQSPEVQSRKELIFTSSGHNYFSPVQDFSDGSDSAIDTEPDSADLGVPVTGGVFLVFENNKYSKIGIPLPAGTMRVYKKDKDGVSQFIGEDKIRHTPEGERVRARLGKSFDVSARRKLVSFKNLPSVGWMKKTLRQGETGIRVTFKNAKNTSQKVIYREVIAGEWKIVSESQDHKKLSQDTAEWQLTVPPKGQLTLNFRVQVALRR